MQVVNSLSFSKAYHLRSPSGMEVVLLETGASVTEIWVPDRRGAFANVALPLLRADDPSCAGVTLAPYAGRIPGGLLRIDGEEVRLSVNEGPNQLHGGAGALHRRPWRCIGRESGSNYQEICFSCPAEDGLDGYPGNRQFAVCYRLYDDQQLRIELTAVTDRPTRVNLSNHAYFNLSGDFFARVDGHLLQIQAGQVYLNDEAFLVKGLGAPPASLDYRLARPVGGAQGDLQRAQARGLNHCYVLSHAKDEPAATLTDPLTGRRMRLYTDQPCLTVYSGGFLASPGCAIALEAQGHPESPFAAPETLYPGEVYRRTITYRFDTAGDPP